MIVSKVKPVLTAILPRLGRVKRWVYLFLIYEYQIHPAKIWLRRDWNWMSEVSNSWHIRGSQKSESGLKCYRTPRVLGWKCNKLQVQKGKVHLKKKKKRREQKPSKRLGVNRAGWNEVESKGRWVISENGTGWSHFLVAGQVLWMTWNLDKNQG